MHTCLHAISLLIGRAQSATKKNCIRIQIAVEFDLFSRTCLKKIAVLSYFYAWVCMELCFGHHKNADFVRLNFDFDPPFLTADVAVVAVEQLEYFAYSMSFFTFIPEKFANWLIQNSPWTLNTHTAHNVHTLQNNWIEFNLISSELNFNSLEIKKKKKSCCCKKQHMQTSEHKNNNIRSRSISNK